MLLREVVDELLDKHRLTHAGAAEQAGLAAADIGLEQVDSLDAGLEDLSLCRELVKRRCGMVNRVVGVDLGHLLAVNRLAHDVPDATERALAHRHLHGGAGINDLEPALEAVGGGHGNAANNVAGQLALDLKDGADVTDGRVDVNRQRVVDVRHAIFELDVHNGADDSRDATDAGSVRCVHSDGICH